MVDSVTNTCGCDLSKGLAVLGLEPSFPETASAPPSVWNWPLHRTCRRDLSTWHQKEVPEAMAAPGEDVTNVETANKHLHMSQ